MAANCGSRQQSMCVFNLVAHCGFPALVRRPKFVLHECPLSSQGPAEGIPMKKLLIALVATLVAVSVSGCVGIGKGKGKAPPPVVTKG